MDESLECVCGFAVDLHCLPCHSQRNLSFRHHILWDCSQYGFHAIPIMLPDHPSHIMQEGRASQIALDRYLHRTRVGTRHVRWNPEHAVKGENSHHRTPN